jgi:hypothetical protein
MRASDIDGGSGCFNVGSHDCAQAACRDTVFLDAVFLAKTPLSDTKGLVRREITRPARV